MRAQILKYTAYPNMLAMWCLAGHISYHYNHSWAWAILHAVTGWLYLTYAAIRYLAGF